MERKRMIDHLVERKLASSSKGKALCVCMARSICWAATQQTVPVNPKK